MAVATYQRKSKPRRLILHYGKPKPTAVDRLISNTQIEINSKFDKRIGVEKFAGNQSFTVYYLSNAVVVGMQ